MDDEFQDSGAQQAREGEGAHAVEAAAQIDAQPVLGQQEPAKEPGPQRPSVIFIFRVTTGQEKIVSQMLEKKAKAQKIAIYSILVPENVKGYLFVEAATENDAVNLAQKVRHVKGLLRKHIELAEIDKMVKAEKPAALTIEIGDIVEIKSGAFKGDKAKVTKIDDNKDELTVEFMDMAVPIPTTIKRKIAKLVTKAKDLGEY